MRLLIYLLAMMTGFSAAQAARPVSATPATLGSAAVQGAVVAASVAVVRHKATSAINSNGLSFSILWVSPTATKYRLAAASPVIRHDLTRQ